MKLHNDKELFSTLVTLAAKSLRMTPAFVEKDYWITLILYNLANSPYVDSVVFKGGTSLSKGYRLINRFSEDIDIAMIEENLSGNALKTKIRNIEKEITVGFAETVDPNITSKGSMFRKSVFEYPSSISGILLGNTARRIIVEINSFANPYPYVKQDISSFITEFLLETNKQETIERYNLQGFSLNVLDKRRTMIEKLVSLVRFSFSENPTQAIQSKIRHFYDLYYLAQDTECTEYIGTDQFKTDFLELFEHDKAAFDTPDGWRMKEIMESPLTVNLPVLWEGLRATYQNELAQLAFTEIPNEKKIAESFEKIINRIAE
ncbi:MAG: nucleotidyl transferase AbiEii/AbiGii toxin family protein [Paludibacter sp.]|nr:nucleotidyl transferase AbiEii/AbiGii toxin family protein [Paludibacter sp.]MDD4198784.1 nucleotidyl transferase AbiEii/AbiGii toxin family protein [Paludibacter sp.]MDD4428321.1 nucleotidyl transferase AbiEii/AbiGii toxin family protein [Paludibacter sp.]